MNRIAVGCAYSVTVGRGEGNGGEEAGMSERQLPMWRPNRISGL